MGPLRQGFLVSTLGTIRELVSHASAGQPLFAEGESVAVPQVLGNVVGLLGPRRRRNAGDLLLETLGLGPFPDTGSNDRTVLDDHGDLDITRGVRRNVDVHELLRAILNAAVVRPESGEDLAERLPFVAQDVDAETRLGIEPARKRYGDDHVAGGLLWSSRVTGAYSGRRSG